MATPEDMAREIAEELGERFSDLDVRETFLAWTQDGIDEILASGRFLQSNTTIPITIVLGVSQYTLPNNISEVLTFRFLDEDGNFSGESVFASRESLIRRGKDITAQSSAVPPHWFYSGVSADGSLLVQFSTVPSGTLQLITTAAAEALKQPPTPSATTEIPLPREFLSVLKELVRFKAYRNGNETELAQISFQLYNSRLELLIGRFLGPFQGGSNLPVKTRMKNIDQAPAAADGD